MRRGRRCVGALAGVGGYWRLDGALGSRRSLARVSLFAALAAETPAPMAPDARHAAYRLSRFNSGWGVAVLLVIGSSVASIAGDAVDTGKAAQDSATNADAAKFVEKTTERGPVKARVRLEPAAPVIGDTVTLTVEVTAADGIELMMPEFGQSLDRFSVREFVPKQTVDATGNQVDTQRY